VILTYSIIYFRKEREANAQLGKQRFSKLLAPAEGAHDDNDDDNEEENKSHQSEVDLSHPVKELCKTVDAFIYVVDSSADSQRGNVNYCLQPRKGIEDIKKEHIQKELYR